MRQKICTESMYSWLPGRLSNGTHKRMSWVSTALLNLISVDYEPMPGFYGKEKLPEPENETENVSATNDTDLTIK